MAPGKGAVARRVVPHRAAQPAGPMTTDGGSRVRRWLGPWLLLIALGVAVATGFGIMRLNDVESSKPCSAGSGPIAATRARWGAPKVDARMDALLARLLASDPANSAARAVGAELAAPFAVAGHQVVARASIGIAHSVPGATSAEELLRNADIATYEARKQGKGQYEVVTSGMDQSAWRRLEVEAELRIALEQQQFERSYSRSWTSTAARSATWGSWCAGTTPPAGCSLRLTSSPWPRRPA
jgi:Diguanylate cyclase, GGDEF domain